MQIKEDVPDIVEFEMDTDRPAMQGLVSSTTGNNHTNVGNASAESMVYTYDNGDNILTETRASSSTARAVNIINKRSFDSWGRLTQTSQNLNSGGDKIISQLTYRWKNQSGLWLMAPKP